MLHLPVCTTLKVFALASVRRLSMKENPYRFSTRYRKPLNVTQDYIVKAADFYSFLITSLRQHSTEEARGKEGGKESGR